MAVRAAIRDTLRRVESGEDEAETIEELLATLERLYAPSTPYPLGDAVESSHWSVGEPLKIPFELGEIESALEEAGLSEEDRETAIEVLRKR